MNPQQPENTPDPSQGTPQQPINFGPPPQQPQGSTELPVQPQQVSPTPEQFSPQNDVLSQPSQSAPSPSNQPLPQFESPVPQAPAMPLQSAQHQTEAPGSAMDIEYHSQPFAAAASGLGKLLVVNPVSAITTTFVAILLFVGIMLVNTLLAFAFSSTPIITVLFSIASFVLGILLLIRLFSASIVLFVTSYKNQPITGRYALMKGSSEKIGSYILASIIYGIVVILGLVLFVVPGIFLGVRLSLYGFAAYDEKLSATASLKRSWNLTKGHFFETFSALLAQTLLVGQGLLSSAATNSGAAARYFEIKNLQDSATQKPKTHWLNFLLPFIVIIFVGGYMAISLAIASNSKQSSGDFQFETLEDFNSDSEFRFNSDDFETDFNSQFDPNFELSN